MSKKADLPTVLAFQRKLDPSDAIFYSGQWEDKKCSVKWPTIDIKEKSVRGTISNDLKASEQDPAKLDAEIEKANLQTVDVAALPANADTLKLQFTLRVLDGVGQPSACNDVQFQKKLQTVVQAYMQEHGYKELSNRYAANLANARYLWRNRQGAEAVSVEIAVLKNGEVEKSWEFDALGYSLREMEVTDPKVKELGTVIAEGFTGVRHVLLQVTTYARAGAGQEVFPSQELILDASQTRKVNGKAVKKSKTLYEVAIDGVKAAAMHSQKVGNAIRSIDTWYPKAKELGPIAIEPYGSVTTQAKAYREPKDQDFYTLLRNWILADKTPTLEQQHFVMAVLIRGGVFSNAKAKD